MSTRAVQSRYQTWEIGPQADGRDALAAALDLHPLVAQVLISRGYDTPESASAFLNPTTEVLRGRPLPNSQKFVDRIALARSRGEKVLVYGDYDVDGTTGTALLIRYLKSIGLQVLYFVPSREGRGYGLHADILNEAKKNGVTLAITVDCGSEDVENARAVRKLGIDLIITDHHPAKQPNPEAFLTINPYINGYPFRYVCGAGVAYKLAAECSKTLGGSLDGLLALASFGTIADVMPLVDENRALARLGLEEMVQSSLAPLVALREHLGLEKEKVITETDIMYKVAPIINAAGRRGVPHLSVNLFLAEDTEVAHRLLNELSTKNDERRELSKGVLEEAMEQARQVDTARVPVLFSDHWPVSIISQVAGQISSILKRPVIILAPRPGNGTLQGSARSVRGFDLKAAVLSQTLEVVEDLGGHNEAFGLSLARDRLDEFMEKVRSIEVLAGPAKMVVDAELTPDLVTTEFWRDLNKLGPFGPLNPPPLFLMRKATVVSAERVGPGGRHLRVILSKSGKRVLGFYQYAGERWKDVLGKTLSIIFFVTRDFSTRRVALEIQDLREDV